MNDEGERKTVRHNACGVLGGLYSGLVSGDTGLNGALSVCLLVSHVKIGSIQKETFPYCLD